jgi:hypothetical protein
MSQSALDRCCEKYGCAKVYLDPKLHSFDDCFGGKIRMGDLDGAVERNNFILWVEWKRGGVLERFDQQFSAQVRQARAFTENSDRQTFVFVIGDPLAMQVEAFRIMHKGKWLREWEHTDLEGFKAVLRRWFEHADKRPAIATKSAGTA